MNTCLFPTLDLQSVTKDALMGLSLDTLAHIVYINARSAYFEYCEDFTGFQRCDALNLAVIPAKWRSDFKAFLITEILYDSKCLNSAFLYLFESEEV